MLGELKTKAKNCHEVNTHILKMQRNIWFPIKYLHKHIVCCYCFKIVTSYSWLCSDVTLWGWRDDKIQELTTFPGTSTEQTVSKFGTWWSDAERFNTQDRVAGRRGQHPSCSWSCRTAHCCKILMEFWKKKVLHNLFTQCTHSLFHAHTFSPQLRKIGLKYSICLWEKAKCVPTLSLCMYEHMCEYIYHSVHHCMCVCVCVCVCVCMCAYACCLPCVLCHSAERKSTSRRKDSLWQTCGSFLPPPPHSQEF